MAEQMKAEREDEGWCVDITIRCINIDPTLTDEMEINTEAKRMIREWATGKGDGRVGVVHVQGRRVQVFDSSEPIEPEPED